MIRKKRNVARVEEGLTYILNLRRLHVLGVVKEMI